MASATVKLPEDLLRRLSKLGEQTDRIAEIVLEAGADVVVSKVRSNLQSAIGRDTQEPSRSTGQLLSALGVSPVKVNRNGDHDIKIGFAENRDDGRSNALIANVLEHGTSTQPARPFLKSAKTATKKQALEVMTAKLEEEINRL